MVSLVVLTVALTVLVTPVLVILLYIAKCFKDYFQFYKLQQLKNKNGKVLRRAPAFYGLGSLLVYADPTKAFKEILSWATSSDLNRDGIFETLNSGYIQLSVSDAAMLKQITIKDNAKFPKSKLTYDVLQTVLGLGLVTSSGSTWQRHRRIIGPLFSEKSIQLMTSKMIRHAVTERDLIYERFVGKKTGFDFGNFASRLTLQIISSCAFGIDNDENGLLEYLSNKWVTLFALYASLPIYSGYILFGLAFKKFNFGANREFMQTMKDIEHKVGEIIEDRRMKLESSDDHSNTEEYPDLLTLLITARDENGDGLSKQQIMDESQTFLFAGHETTSSLLTWMFYMFCIHHDIQQRVITEVDEFFNSGGEITFESIQSLKYLNQVINETLRLYPPVTNVDRYASQDCYLGDYFVPRGTEITLNILGLHRSEKYWKNANTFDPDRWTDERLAELPEKVSSIFTPFSKGARDCIGKRFAVVEAGIITTLILRKFSVCFAEGCTADSVGTEMSITVKPTNLKVIFNERATV